MQQDNAAKSVSGLGWFFLILIAVHVSFSIAFSLLAQKNITFPVEILLVVSELTIIVPAFIYALIKNMSFADDLGFRPIKPATFFMCILLSFLVTPVASLVNAISQLFVSNRMVSVSDTLAGGSSAAVLFLGAIYAPLCEEFVFRGVIARRYEKYIGPLGAMFISSVFFGLAHLNINQAAYAFVLGLIFMIINKAAGSIFASIIIHVCINGGNLLLLLTLSKAYKMMGDSVSFAESAEAARQSDILYAVIAVLLVIVMICIAIAIPCVVFISKSEGHFEELRDMFTVKYPKFRWVTVSSVTAIAFTLFVMFGLSHFI